MTTAARYAHGPEIAERLTAWLETTRRQLLAEAAERPADRDGGAS